jgi:hypothetical protein
MFGASGRDEDHFDDPDAFDLRRDTRPSLHFGAGPRATEYQRPVNDQTFNIALVLVFETKADHDRYQVSERHQQFISTCNECWSEVRVFDAFV